MREHWNRLTAWWHWLWTGYHSEAELRRYLEHEVHRFGGVITWRTKSKR